MPAPKYKSLKECFDALVIKGEDCWLCTRVHSNGYGRFPFKGIRYYSHRVAWELYYGPIPEGFQILHHCDNPICCNPNHLFIGKAKDNVADMIQKGRGGVIPRIIKATPDVKNKVINLYLNGISQGKIAASCGLSIRTVNKVISESRYEKYS